MTACHSLSPNQHDLFPQLTPAPLNRGERPHQQGGKSHLGWISDLSSKLAPGPLPDSPVLDSPIGLDTVARFGSSALARLADARRSRMHALHVAHVGGLALVVLPVMQGPIGSRAAQWVLKPILQTSRVPHQCRTQCLSMQFLAYRSKTIVMQGLVH